MSKPTILLKSGWNRYNFGDIAHTPGFLRLAQRYLPEAHIIVWASSYPEWLTGYLLERFPEIEVVSGHLGQEGEPATPELDDAYNRADLFIFNSGPIFNYGHEIVDGEIVREGWRSYNWNPTVGTLIPLLYAKSKGVPFGIFAQSFIFMAHPGNMLIENVLSQAAFISTRESDSLRYIKSLGFSAPDMGFTPDAAWGMDLYDDDAVLPWLAKHNLEPGQFLAMTTRNVPRGIAEERDASCQRELWAAVTRTWLEETDMPIVLVPETQRSIELNKELIAGVVPDEYADRVVIDDSLWGDPTEFWIPDQANSLLSRAFAYVNMDHHGALQALAAGIPTLHPHQPQAGRKNYIYRDLNLSDWLFDAYQADAPRGTAQALSAIIKDRDGAVSKAKAAAERVRDLQKQRFDAIRKLILT